MVRLGMHDTYGDIAQPEVFAIAFETRLIGIYPDGTENMPRRYLG